MLSKTDVTDLYLQYGFEEGPSYDQYLVFFSQKGYFQNAEIVILDEAVDSSDIDKSEYEGIGYSVRIRRFSDITAVHDALFSGFFSTSMSNRKLLAEYSAFCLQQKNKLVNNEYEYISGSYVENGLLQNGNVIDRILELFNTNERQLIILEASAGFGKTCTSFEVIRYLVEKIPTKIPLLAELSKNRKASVFRYVLLSEIDQKFPALSSELVTSEIQEGRIFLIIDGFDELLSKSYSTLQEIEHPAGKDAQTMLDTIAQLIPNGSKTKILLTSRKSSLFVGESFDNWVTQHLAECNITRLQLSQPSLRDWIGAEKIEALKKNSISLRNILNPVLLTLLRNEPLATFEEKYTSNDRLIEQYLNLLLQREQTRQALPLSVEEQISIMQDLAVQMVQFDISAEDIDFIKLILSDAIAPRLEEYLKRYDYLPDVYENKPTETEFITKLSQHALLDRVSTQSNLIGFINEFIFGLMIANAVVENRLPASELQGKYLDIAVTAYSSYGFEKRKALYDRIVPALENESAQRQISTSMHLIDAVIGSYSNQYFDGLLFGRGLDISNAGTFKDCMFSDCIFERCIINTDAFQNCQFYSCSFYDNKIASGNILDCELTFLSCTGHEVFSTLAFRTETVQNVSVNYERVILEQFWKPGYDTAEPNRTYHALLRGVSSSDRQALVDAIESLVKKDILIKKLRVYELNFEKMDVIRGIINR